MKQLIFEYSLKIHVLAGILALLSGLIAMSYGKKGGKVHKITGILFYWSMLIIFISSIEFIVMFPQNIKYHFFLMIGIVSFYPTWAGKRVLSMKKAIEPQLLDYMALFLIGFSGLVMLGYGVLGFVNPSYYSQYKILFLVFGVISLLNFYVDGSIYFKWREPLKMHWFFSHGGKMMGAYSAALTAFCVNVLPGYLPANTPSFVYILTWVGPGVFFGILAQQILKKYKKKFEKAL